MTNGATGPTLATGDIKNYVKSIGVRRNGKEFKFNLPLDLLVDIETKNMGKAPARTAPDTTGSATYDAIQNFSIHFAQDVLNDRDITALLQTKNLSNLEIVVNAGDASDIATANAPTINSAKIEIIATDWSGGVSTDADGRPTGFVGDKDINDSEQVRMIDIIEQTEELDLEAGKTQFDKNAQDIDLVAGANILEHAILVTDNGARSDARVTDLKFQRVRPRKKDELETPWNNIHEDNETEYGLPTTINGVVFIDWQRLLGRAGFVTGSKSSDLLKVLTNGITATQDKIEIYTKWV